MRSLFLTSKIHLAKESLVKDEMAINTRGNITRIPIHVEIWIASRLLSEKNEIFSKKELTVIIKEIFDDTRPGISTHISSCCVANKPSNHPRNYNYLFWLSKGKYKIYIKGNYLHPDKKSSQNKPNYEDVPCQFRYLLDKTLGSKTVISKPPIGQYQLSSLGQDEREEIIGKINLDILRNCEQEAIDKTMLMMAYNPSCARIFSNEANKKIKKKIFSVIELLPEIKTQKKFDTVHKNILDVIVNNIKNFRKNNPSGKISYGQAQKGLNVFLKVFVDWANRPFREVSQVVRKFLHCPLDSIVMKAIKRKEKNLYKKYENLPCDLKSISTYEQYINWQRLIDEILVNKAGSEKRTLIDVIWFLESLKRKEINN